MRHILVALLVAGAAAQERSPNGANRLSREGCKDTCSGICKTKEDGSFKNLFIPGQYTGYQPGGGFPLDHFVIPNTNASHGTVYSDDSCTDNFPASCSDDVGMDGCLHLPGHDRLPRGPKWVGVLGRRL